MNQHRLLQLVATVGLLLGPQLLPAQTTRPEPDWLRSYFSYDPPAELKVEETTPTKAQLAFRGRPPLAEDDLQCAAGANATTIDQVNILRLRFRDIDGEIVPAFLCTPKGKPGPFPLTIAIHGMGSNKAQVCGQLAPSLAKQGFAVLAPDMPAHGERPGNPREILNTKDWVTAIQLHHRAIIDIRQCMDLASIRPELDVTNGIVLAGYSMGSWLDSVAGPLDPRVKAMVLMVGGATDAAPLLRMLPQLAAADPLQSLPQFAGRPLLMLNGRFDTTVTPAMTERLFAAAAEPKQLKWYDSGHHLPDGAYLDAAGWIAKTWTSLNAPAESLDQPSTSRPTADGLRRSSSLRR